MYGALKSRATLLVPWLVTTGLACLAAIIFASLNWQQLSSNQVDVLRLPQTRFYSI